MAAGYAANDQKPTWKRLPIPLLTEISVQQLWWSKHTSDSREWQGVGSAVFRVQGRRVFARKSVLGFTVEVCMGMGMGNRIPMVFIWDSHGNGISFGLLMGMGIAYFIGENKILFRIYRFIITQNVAHLSWNMLLSNIYLFSLCMLILKFSGLFPAFEFD